MDNRVGTALALSLLSYFPELSHGGYPDMGAFLDEYFSLPCSERPETMFSGLCADGVSGVVQAMKVLRKRKKFRDMKIVCDSSGSRRFNSFCALCPESRTAYIVIGGNYRVGFYRSGSGVTSSWCDNFLGAVQDVTAEQKDILSFYDRAVSYAEGYRIVVCGHSKGGNLAQYITLMRENAGICFSFDGQGFSDTFIKNHRRQIQTYGGKIFSIYPGASIVGASLIPIPTAKRYTVRERTVRRGVLYSHIPAALFDRHLRLGKLSGSETFIQKYVRRLSVRSIAAAQIIPFISAESGLLHIGRALQYTFKDEPRRGLCELFDRDALLMLMLFLAELPLAVFGK